MHSTTLMMLTEKPISLNNEQIITPKHSPANIKQKNTPV